MPTEVAAQGLWTNRTEADWISFDLKTQLISAIVKQPGRGPDIRRLRKEQPATFKFDADGADGDQTVIMVDGEESELSEIPERATVHIYWRSIDKDRYGMFAFKVVYLSEEMLAEQEAAAADE